jgi:hypothetical protein
MPRTTKRSEVPEQFRPTTGPLANEKQVAYLDALAQGKDLDSLTEEQQNWLQTADFATIPKMRASTVIETLVALPWKKKTNVALAGVEDGRYAVEKDDGTLMFYSVKNGHSKVFVDVWASDTRYPIGNISEIKRVLDAIKADPDAGPRFGREIGRCYVCGRTLTDETSRQLGIGPVCRGDQ